MKALPVSAALLVFAGVASAQERVPQDHAEKIAHLLVEQAAKQADLPFPSEADPHKPFAIHSAGRAAVIIPAKGLSADALARAGKDITPVGQLWFRQIAPYAAGKVTPNDQLRIVTVRANGEDHALPLCLLGVRKSDKGEPELLVFGKGKEPLLRLPLQKIDRKQELPIELEAKRDGDTARLTLNLLGKYQAVLPVAEQAP
jgi:hypothetical protein